MNQDYMLSEICRNPTFLAGIDWKEFTEWFDEGRIHEIIKTIDNDAVCDLVCDYIKAEWYLAANGKIKTNPDKPCQSLIEYTGETLWNGEQAWYYRFEPIEDEEGQRLPRIEDLVDEALTERERMKKREARKKDLRERGERLMSASLPERKVVGKSSIVSASELKMHLDLKNAAKETEIRQLKSEIEDLQSENNSLRLKLKDLEGLTKKFCNKISGNMPKSRSKFYPNDYWDEIAENIKMAEIESKKGQYAKEKLIEMLHHFIEFGEKYPSNMNAKGEAIREIIDDYLKFHPDCLFDEEWYNRLQKLGRKEVTMKIETINSQNTHIKDSSINSFYEQTK